MKFIARLRIRKDVDVSLMLKAFFSSFNKENKIIVKDNEVFLTIVFEEDPPHGIINAMSDYEVSEFFFVSDIDHVSDIDKEPTVVDEITKKAVEKSNNNIAKHEEGDDTKTLMNLEEIPAIKEIIQSSVSFEDALAQISKWLGFNNYVSFESLIKSSISTGKDEKISWGMIFKNMGKNLKGYTNETVRIQFTTILAKKMKEENFTIKPLTFIAMVARYSNYWTKNNDKANTTAELSSVNPLEAMVKNLTDIVKEGSTEERVEKIFTSMGLQESDSNLLILVYTALKLPGEMTWENIYNNQNEFTSTEERMDARRKLSELVNKFAKKSGYSNQIKLITFLMELKKAILSDQS